MAECVSRAGYHNANSTSPQHQHSPAGGVAGLISGRWPLVSGGITKLLAPVRSRRITRHPHRSEQAHLELLAHDFDTVDNGIFERIAQAIDERGYAVIDAGLPKSLVDALFLHICDLPDSALTPAGVGREDDHHVNRFVRSDETLWLEPAQPAARGLLAWMESLRQGINRRLFLGLFDYEAHYARYAPGAFYRQHLDAFAGGGTNRVLSTVLYLNPTWGADDGGEFVLYAEDGSLVLEKLTPLYGRLVVFLSERFPHEVLPTRRTRYSVAGWFRVNGSLGGQIDPPR